MTHFEYLSVSISIMLSLAAARAIGGLPHALQSGRRDWLHASWIFVWLWVLVTSWWNIWGYRSTEFDFVSFLFLLAPSSSGLFSLLTSPFFSQRPHHRPTFRGCGRAVRLRSSESQPQAAGFKR
jgi:hypothetical protein